MDSEQSETVVVNCGEEVVSLLTLASSVDAQGFITLGGVFRGAGNSTCSAQISIIQDQTSRFF
jgi:hypothetical protein